jgi:hypothetical protein
LPNFEVYTGGSASRRKGAVVTIYGTGHLSLSPEAFEALGSPEAVELLFDRGERVIGLRRADPDLPHSYRVRRPANSPSYAVYGKTFLRHYGVELGPARRYPAAMVGDVLAVDLKAGAPVPARRTSTKGSEAGADA